MFDREQVEGSLEGSLRWCFAIGPLQLTVWKVMTTTKKLNAPLNGWSGESAIEMMMC